MVETFKFLKKYVKTRIINRSLAIALYVERILAVTIFGVPIWLQRIYCGRKKVRTGQ